MSYHTILWGVDVQADFMLPSGKLYVPGADHLLPNIRRLTDATRLPGVFLVSTGDAHSPNDSEFETFPPHCLKGTPGAELVPEALADTYVRLENDPRKKPHLRFVEEAFPLFLRSAYHQILLEKQTIDIFQTHHADEIVEHLGDVQYVVFGVVMEYCVAAAARGLLMRGRRVTLVRDAIKTLNFKEGIKTLNELQKLGVTLTTTDEILQQIRSHSSPALSSIN
jgi:nicotinamidase-related amidase